MKKSFLAILFLLSLFLVTGCKDEIDENAIYTTVYPIGFIIREISGDDFHVKSVYPMGADIHDYELSPKELSRIINSKALFYIGAGLEPFIESGLDSTFKGKPVKLINLTQNMELSPATCEGIHCAADLFQQENDGQTHFNDPHIWLSPKRMIDLAVVIKAELVELRPEGSTIDYEANFNGLITRLQGVDQSLKDAIAGGDVDTIIVDHDAYQYWTTDYGLKRTRLRTDNDSTDTNAKELQEIIDEAKQLDITHILVTQNEAANPNINAILGQIDGEISYIHHMAVLTEEEYEKNLNYFDLMTNNINTIKEALDTAG